MESWFEIKLRGILGLDEGDCSSITILGRTVSADDFGIHYEADVKHRQLIIEHFGLDQGGKSVNFNGEKDDKEAEDDMEELESYHLRPNVFAVWRQE